MFFKKNYVVGIGILAFSACSNDGSVVRSRLSNSQTAQNSSGASGLADYVFDPYIPGDSLIGVSHIAHESSLDRQTFDFGVATLLRLNLKSVFFYLTPEYRSKYLQQDFGTANPKTLTELADLPPYRRAFFPFTNIVLTCTADSFSTIGLNIRDHYLTDAEYAANRKEFFDLTTYLMKTYNGTKKRFILKNWEGDWLLLNGYDENADVPDSRVTNFVRWFRSTQEGIAEARRIAASESDVKVDFALELNRIAIVQAGKRNTILGSVVPQVPSDWVSYSAWETISNRGGSQDPEAIYKTVVADLTDIKRRAGRPLFISEFGYPESDYKPGLQRAQVQAAIRGFKDAGIPLAFYWNVYEKPYGLFRTDGKLTPNEAFDALRNEAMIEQVNESKYLSSEKATNVANAYWQVFGRKPDAGGFDYWANHKDSSNAALIRKYFTQSPEALRVVAQTYQNYAGFEPDNATVQSLRAQLENGSTIYDVAGSLYLDKVEGRLTKPSSTAPSTPLAQTPQPTTAPSTGCVGSSLNPGRGLAVGQWLCSGDGRFILSMQKDGNLVIYQGQKALWASNTNRSGVTSAQFQNDGNLVIYAGSNAVWASNTGGKKAINLSMQNDGNLVIYNGSAAIWASNTGGR